MRYLIHNIYGDADELLASAPSDVECIARLWTLDGEAALQDLAVELGIAGVSCLPSLLYWRAEQTIEDPEDGVVVIPAHWAELRVADMPKPWSWAAIESALAVPDPPP